MRHRFTKNSNTSRASRQLTLENSVINEAENIKEFVNEIKEQAAQINSIRKENERLKEQLGLSSKNNL